MDEERSMERVRVLTPSRIVTLPWQSAQDFVGRALAAYPTAHQVVEQFRAVGTSRPVELSDPNDRTFVLAVIEAWAAQVGMEALPPGISELTTRCERIGASRAPTLSASVRCVGISYE